jgi:TrmH family RNA methyltransferase
VEQFSKSGVRVESIHLKEIESIAATETSQGILATFAIPPTGLAELYCLVFRKVVLCENISDPGNLGTLLRSAKAFRFDMVLLAGRSADPFSPKVVRASVGAIFGLPIAVAGVDEITAFLAKHAVQMMAADIHGTTELVKAHVRRDKATILAIGSEADGLSEELLRRADAKIRIRHSDAVESLNAAVAGSILMHELYNLYE